MWCHLIRAHRDTEITEAISHYPDLHCEWSVNEKVGMETVIGASIAGVRAMTCMKHVGLNVAADPLFTASYTGVGAGLVVVVADDPGMHSSQNEQDSRHYARAAKLPMFEPSDSQECADFTRIAFRLSEQYDTPVMIRLTTRVSHSRSLVEESDPEIPEVKPYAKDMAKFVMILNGCCAPRGRRSSVKPLWLRPFRKSDCIRYARLVPLGM